jgi:acyl-CoA thioester hydrolase
MLSFDYRHRVRYRECDPMGVVYHTHYVDYFEVARTEALRSLGLPYAELEQSGINMPVIDLSVQYRRPARYDDVLIVHTEFPEMRPLARVRINYVVHRENEPDDVIVTGHVSLCFVDATSGRPVRAPARVLEVFEGAAPS